MARDLNRRDDRRRPLEDLGDGAAESFGSELHLSELVDDDNVAGVSARKSR
jgi:hypothetical protein